MNKNEYILKEEAILAINGQPTELHYPDWYASQIKTIKPVDVAPVIHAHWIYKHGELHCSRCNERILNIIHRGCLNYCPDCGAIMDETKDEVISNGEKI